MAFLTIDWISGALNNLLFAVDAFFTQKRPFSGMYSSHGSFFVPSNKSSNVYALKDPTFNKILSAVLKNILARAIPSKSVRKVTLPSSTLTISYPKSRISLFNTASSPKWHGAISSTVFIHSPLYFYSFPILPFSLFFVNCQLL